MRWIAFVASLAGVFFALQWIVGIRRSRLLAATRTRRSSRSSSGLTAFTIGLGIPAAYLIAIFRTASGTSTSS